MDRLIMLGIGVNSGDQWAEAFQDMSELARSLGETYDFVDVRSSVIGKDEDLYSRDVETLYHDDQTISKVHDVICSLGLAEHANDIINDLQNCGILFRERIPS